MIDSLSLEIKVSAAGIVSAGVAGGRLVAQNVM
jgi:hypothetical protein